MTKAEKTKQLILEKAAPIFNEKGVAGTSIDDVLAAANVAKGCLYGHFENKEDLAFQTVDYLLNKVLDEIRAQVDIKKLAKEKIFAYMDFHSDPLHPVIAGGCPIFNMAVESDDNNLPIRNKIKQVVQTGVKRFTAMLQEGIDNCEFKNTLNPENFAFKMFAAIEGMIVVCRILGTNSPMENLIKDLKKELDTYQA